MSEPLAFLGGRWLPQSQALLPLHDAGFVMGATVTDLCRTFHQKLYRWRDHLARFEQSCQASGILPLLSSAEITAHAERLIQHNAALATGGQELILVLFATPGPLGHYIGADDGFGPVTFGMHTFPLPYGRYRRLLEEGAALIVPSVRQLPAVCVPPGIKMRSRMHWWLAEREAQRLDPGAVALLLDEAGYLTETAAANVLLVRDGKLLSPPSSCILEGISRRVVMELCVKLGLPFEEASADCRRSGNGSRNLADEHALLPGRGQPLQPQASCLARTRVSPPFASLERRSGP